MCIIISYTACSALKFDVHNISTIHVIEILQVSESMYCLRLNTFMSSFNKKKHFHVTNWKMNDEEMTFGTTEKNTAVHPSTIELEYSSQP